MAGLSDVYESALEKLVERGRGLLATAALFAVGIALAGAVRTIQLNGLDSQERALTVALGTTWEPIESLYSRSFTLLESYAAEHSTPWSQAYFVISFNLIFVEDVLQKSGKSVKTVQKSLERVAKVGNRLHDYNSDIRLIAAAQRRGQSFEQLSRRELEALVRIFQFDLTEEEEATLADTYKFAVVTLKLLGERTEPPRLSDETKALLDKFVDQKRWTSLRSALTFSDMRVFGKLDTKSPEFLSLSPRIAALPGESIHDVRARRREIGERAERIREEAGVSLPFLGTEVSADALLLTGALASLFMAASFFNTMRRAELTWNRLVVAAPGTPAAYGAEVFSDLAVGKRVVARTFQSLLLLAPLVMATLLFFRDTKNILALILSGIAALATIGFAAITNRVVSKLPSY